jgi:hypothetical protein
MFSQNHFQLLCHMINSCYFSFASSGSIFSNHSCFSSKFKSSDRVSSGMINGTELGGEPPYIENSDGI